VAAADSTANGTVYGIWYHDDDPPGVHPVVSFGDEGEIRVLAPNIKAFFTEWASGRGVGWLAPFTYDYHSPSQKALPALLAERHAYGARMLAIINAMPDPPPGSPIAELDARLNKTVAASLAIADEFERQKRLVELYGDRIDLASPEQFWPRSRPFPKLISDLGMFMKPLINGSIGRFDMKGQLMSDWWIHHGAELHGQFGFFLVDQKYRAVAIWYHDGAAPGSEPVVGIQQGTFREDEDAVVLAPTLKAYINRWAVDVALDNSDLGLNEEPEIKSLRPELSRRMLDLVAASGKTPPSQSAPDFVAFIRNHIAQERARDDADPVLQKMAEILRPRFPPPDNVISWSMSVTSMGDTFEFSLGQGLREGGLPEEPALVPLLAEARAARAKGRTASLGPWKSAHLSLTPEGRIELVGYWTE
jgi:hypothetical protein